QLERHSAQFSEWDVFFQECTGCPWRREAMRDNTDRHACGRYTRELVEGSVQVLPVDEFGAVWQGRHRFCDTVTGACDGLADFTMVWRLHEGRWTITRVLSYGHRAAVADSR